MSLKNQDNILSKLGIEALKPMQEDVIEAYPGASEIVVLSPTGTGKTLAFLLPLINSLDPNSTEVQAIILVPTRELAIQIEQVAREMGSGYKINAAYGGQSIKKDLIHLNHRPAILIGTPGRLADHLRRRTFSIDQIKTLILDEFDKSLEIGFEEEMKDIISELPYLSKRVLTSASQEVDIPDFVGLRSPHYINYLHEEITALKIRTVISPTKDKLQTLVRTLRHIGNQPGIIFCNFKDTIQYISDHLSRNNIDHGCFYGGLEQHDRERSLIQFRNGSHQLIVATDLAARGIDIPEIAFIIHYQLPNRSHEFTHRNGRTARMNRDGTAYILKWTREDLPDFIEDTEIVELQDGDLPSPSPWTTLFISGGRKDKISKGDIAGLFFKQGGLERDELGMIELKQDCAFVAVPRSKADQLIQQLNNSRLKKKKVRLTSI